MFGEMLVTRRKVRPACGRLLHRRCDDGSCRPDTALRYRSAAPYTIYFTKRRHPRRAFTSLPPVRSNRKSNNLLFGSIEKALDIRTFLLSVRESAGTAEVEGDLTCNRQQCRNEHITEERTRSPRCLQTRSTNTTAGRRLFIT